MASEKAKTNGRYSATSKIKKPVTRQQDLFVIAMKQELEWYEGFCAAKRELES